MHSWKDRVKKIVKPVVFFLIFVLMFLTVQEIMTPKWTFLPKAADGSFYREGETDRYGQFYALPNDTVDYLILGNSTAYRGINPTLIYAENGITGYALGSSMQRTDLSYYWLREALKTQSPSVVFLEISSLLNKNSTRSTFITQALVPMKLSRNKIDAILNCKNDSQTFAELMFPLIQFHSRWTSLTKNDWAIGNVPDYCMNGAYVDFVVKLDTGKSERTSEYDTIELTDGEYVVHEAQPLEIVEEYKYYFEQIWKLCEENNIELIPIKAPTMSWSKEYSEVTRSLLNEYGLELVDLTDGALVPLRWNKDTGDVGAHVNYWGSSKASDYLAGVLEERGLPDHRGQSGYEDWDKSLQNYQIFEEEHLLTTQESAYAYLNTLAAVKDQVLTIVTVKDEASQRWNETLEAAMRNIGVNSSFYNQIQNSFVAIIDGGVSQFEKWDDHRIKVNSSYPVNASKTLKLSISSAGFVCGNLSSVMVNGVGYSLNNRGLNIVVIDKQTCQVISSASIDTHTSALTFREKTLSAAQAAAWEEICMNSQFIEDGVYNIIPAGNSECAVDIPYGDTAEDANVWLCGRNGLNPQEFELSHIGNGLYTIRAVCSGKYLSIEGMGSTAGSNVVQRAYSGLASQKWFITKNANGSYRFASLYNGQILDVSGGVAAPGTNIQVWTENNEVPQEFFLERVN